MNARQVVDTLLENSEDPGFSVDDIRDTADTVWSDSVRRFKDALLEVYGDLTERETRALLAFADGFASKFGAAVLTAPKAVARCVLSAADAAGPSFTSSMFVDGRFWTDEEAERMEDYVRSTGQIGELHPDAPAAFGDGDEGIERMLGLRENDEAFDPASGDLKDDMQDSAEDNRLFEQFYAHLLDTQELAPDSPDGLWTRQAGRLFFDRFKDCIRTNLRRAAINFWVVSLGFRLDFNSSTEPESWPREKGVEMTEYVLSLGRRPSEQDDQSGVAQVLGLRENEDPDSAAWDIKDDAFAYAEEVKQSTFHRFYSQLLEIQGAPPDSPAGRWLRQESERFLDKFQRYVEDDPELAATCFVADSYGYLGGFEDVPADTASWSVKQRREMSDYAKAVGQMPVDLEEPDDDSSQWLPGYVDETKSARRIRSVLETGELPDEEFPDSTADDDDIKDLAHEHAQQSAADFKEFFRAYLEAALWASTDNRNEQGGDPLDYNFDVDDFDADALAKLKDMAYGFFVKAGSRISTDYSQAGHDFWLSQNGHGAGFFDSDEFEDRDALQDLAETFGEVYISVDWNPEAPNGVGTLSV